MPLSRETKSTLRALSLWPVLFLPILPWMITIAMIIPGWIVAPSATLMATIFLEAVFAGICSFVAFRRWHSWFENRIHERDQSPS